MLPYKLVYHERYDLNLGAPFLKWKLFIFRITETVLSHKICQNEIVI